MKQYPIYLFDLDDTLINNQTAQSHAFDLVIQNFDFTKSLKLTGSKFLEFERSYWNQYHEKKYETKMQELWETEAIGVSNLTHSSVPNATELSEVARAYRFQLLLHCSYEVAVQVNNFYMSHQGKKAEALPNVVETLKELRQTAKNYILTNGPLTIAYEKLERSGLDSCISDVIAYEQCGYGKPDPKFYDYAMTKIKPNSLEQCLMVGDTLSQDIKGANDYGIDSCFYNPKQKENTKGIYPTYEIHDFKQLVKTK